MATGQPERGFERMLGDAASYALAASAYLPARKACARRRAGAGFSAAAFGVVLLLSFCGGERCDSRRTHESSAASRQAK